VARELAQQPIHLRSVAGSNPQQDEPEF
jgi:hypothetical protein